MAGRQGRDGRRREHGAQPGRRAVVRGGIAASPGRREGGPPFDRIVASTVERSVGAVRGVSLETGTLVLTSAPSGEGPLRRDARCVCTTTIESPGMTEASRAITPSPPDVTVGMVTTPPPDTEIMMARKKTTPGPQQVQSEDESQDIAARRVGARKGTARARFLPQDVEDGRHPRRHGRGDRIARRRGGLHPQALRLEMSKQHFSATKSKLKSAEDTREGPHPKPLRRQPRSRSRSGITRRRPSSPPDGTGTCSTRWSR